MSDSEKLAKILDCAARVFASKEFNEKVCLGGLSPELQKDLCKLMESCLPNDSEIDNRLPGKPVYEYCENSGQYGY